MADFMCFQSRFFHLKTNPRPLSLSKGKIIVHYIISSP